MAHQTQPDAGILLGETSIQDILKKVHEICIFGSTNSHYNKRDKKLSKNCLSLFALENFQKKFSPLVSLQDIKICSEYSRTGVEPTTESQRIGFIKVHFIYSSYKASYGHGYSNCEGMAILVLLELIAQDFPGNVRLIRFDNKDNKNVDELNTVVIGNWPNPGCIIFSPWQGECGLYYKWKGSLNEMPELLKFDFDRVRTTFNVSSDEKKYIKNLLIESKYSDWLSNNTERKINLAVARNNFHAHINQAAFFKDPIRSYHCSFRDLTTMARTSKANNEAVEKIKTELLSDKIVEDIFSMPRVLTL